MKKNVSAAVALPTVVAIALGGLLMAAPASAAPAPVEQSEGGAVPVEETGPVVSPAPTPTAVPEAAPVVDEAAPVDAEAPLEETVPAGSADATADAAAETPAAEAAPVAAPVADEPAASADADAAVAALEPAPAAPALDGGAIGLYEVTRDQGATETDVPLTFTGTGLAGAVVSLDFARADGITGVVDPDVTVPVGADGRWSASVRVSPGTSTYTATQRTVDAGGAATSEESAPSAERRIVVIAQVLPQWAVVDMEGDRKWVADTVAEDGAEIAEVYIQGWTGTMYLAELSVVSPDRSTTYEVVRPEEYADGKWSHVFALAPGQYRIAARHIDAETPGPFPRYNSGLNYSPVITVVPSSSVVTTAPVVTSPADGSSVVVPAGRDEVPVTLQGTAEPGYEVYGYARSRDEEGAWASFGAADGGRLLAGADGRWSAAEVELPVGVYEVTVYQYDSSLQNPTTSEPTTLTFEVRAATVVAPAGTGTGTDAGTPVRPVAGGSLAYTGSDETSRALVGGGLAVVLGGLGVVVARLRRRAVQESDVTTLS